MASNSRSEAETERRRERGWLRAGEGRPAALALAVALGLWFVLFDLRPERALRNALFDTYQQVSPRPQGDIGVVVIGIDDRSLSAIGQWPWRRTALAELVARVAAAQPAAIGLDIIFAEPDRYSPSHLARQLRAQRPDSHVLDPARLPDHDREFARVLARSGPVVLGFSGLNSEDRLPTGITYRPPIVQDNAEMTLDELVPRFPGVLHNLDVIESSVSGHGALNRIEEDDSVIRRLPTLLNVAGQVLPSLPLELLRVVSGDPVLRVRLDADGIRSVQAGDWIIPTDRGGQWWVHYSREQDFPVASAVDVIHGRITAETLRDKIVLIGSMSAGIGDRIVTPLGDRSGVIALAEALQGVLLGRVPHRPGWGPWLELGVLAAAAALAILVVPLSSALNAILAFGLVAGLSLVAGGIAFAKLTWLIDVATPLVAAMLVLTAMLLMSLGRAERQRESLRLALDDSREREARLEGELDAARRIQRGMLPDPLTVVGEDPRLDLAAMMQPARTVGGDLYDFFRLDDRHLFFMVGDVSGKGLPASLFMALSKTLIKGAALNVGIDPAAGLTAATRVIARENPEAMFVSVAACTLDLDSGELTWCCAGHEAPFRVRASDRHSTRLDSRGGPPLCMVENFEYPSERLRLTPGDLICLVTDGVTEARNPAGALYGATRFEIALGIAAAESSSHRIVEYLRRDVERFVGGEEPADDLTLLVLRWRGPAGRR